MQTLLGKGQEERAHKSDAPRAFSGIERLNSGDASYGVVLMKWCEEHPNEII